MFSHDTYTLDYFIQKFEEIPSSYIGLSTDALATDAWEWCAADEAEVLFKLIRPYGQLIAVNDGLDDCIYYGADPHSRVLNFLKVVKQKRSFFFHT